MFTRKINGKWLMEAQAHVATALACLARRTYTLLPWAHWYYHNIPDRPVCDLEWHEIMS